MRNTLVGIFGDVDSARRARESLLARGIPEDHVTLSADLTADGVAAEAPGQSFENQPGQSAADSRAAWWGDAVRGGACTVTVVEPGAGVEAWLREGGARLVVRPRGP